MSQRNQSSTGDQNQNIGTVNDNGTVVRDVYGNVYVGPDKRPTTESPEREKIILFIAVDPVDTMSLRLDEEEREIGNALKRTKQGEEFKLEVLRPVRLRDIIDALLEHAPQIVHFSGHGIKTEGFAIADDLGEIKLVTTDELKKLFKKFSTTIECVVLNIGFSKEQSNAIVQHINYVIELSPAIGHETAIEFTKAFYARRGAGISIEDSYDFGCYSITSFQNVQKNFIPVINKKTKPENLIKYRTEAISLIISQHGKNDAQLALMCRKNLEQLRLNRNLLQEEASDIENQIRQMFENFKLDIKAQIEKYINFIDPINFDKFTDNIRLQTSYFQKNIGLGEEAVDETGNRVGDEIISLIYVDIAKDLLCQVDLNKAKGFLDKAKGFLDKAKVFLEEAAKLDKNNPLVYKDLASIWFEKQKYKKALVELNTAKRLFAQKKMPEDVKLEEVKKIDWLINRIPISSRITHSVVTLATRFIMLKKHST